MGKLKNSILLRTTSVTFCAYTHKIWWEKVSPWGIEPTILQVRGYSNLQEPKALFLVQKCP
jgi:hypothetical protein